MAKLIRGVNDLETLRPNLALEWHPTKNGDLRPTDVTTSSALKIWWTFPYDDPKTGKHFDFEWQATVHDRIKSFGCPFLSGQRVWVGFNDLATTHSQLALEWHPTKNGDLKPTDVTAGSSRKKVWWYLPYDDPKTGRHFDFEWQATVLSRKQGNSCPYLSGQAVWKGFNDLETYFKETHFEYMLKEWHPTKNGNLKPSDITYGSNKKIWWLLPYDDPKTRKHFDFEWVATIYSRMFGNNCPYLSGQALWKGFNDLETYCKENHLEHILKQWHPTKNGDLKPSDVISGSSLKVWWYLPYDDPKTGKHFDFEWETHIYSRIRGTNCPYLSNPIRDIWVGFNDLETYCKTNNLDYLLDEWDYSKNKKIMPKNVCFGSSKEVYWKCQSNHTYKTKINVRTGPRYHNCPICAKEKMTSFAEQAIYYYIKKYFLDAINRDIIILNGKELDIYIPSIRIAIEYDGGAFHKDLQRDLIKNQLCRDNKILLIRIRETNCPNISDDEFVKIIDCIAKDEQSLAKAIIKLGEYIGVQFDVNISRDRGEIYSQYIHSIKENSLASRFPELAKQWHPTRNGDLKPTDVSVGSIKKVWWCLPYDDPKTGKHFDFEWEARIADRVNGNGCPYFNGKAIWKGYNDLQTVNPILASEWHPIKNGDLKPTGVSVGSIKKVWWRLPYDDPKTGKHFDFEWEASINNRIKGYGCPYLSGHAVWEGFNDLQTINPKLASEWHPTKNGNLKPSDVATHSNKKVWWKCCTCGYEWRSRINGRKKCEKCKK